ncbi:tetratricopeptide repeat family protein [Orientia tsutsugamushi str. UT76]|nr:tetratricopeptide repeat family protein [Orientia tsutsugamushi str. UT76]
MKFVKYITAVLSLTLLNTTIASKRNNNQPVQQKLIPDKATLAEKHFNVGISFLELNKYQEAIENFDLTIKYNSNCAEAYYNKGICLLELGQYQEAIESYNLAIKYNPNYAKAYNNKGVCLGKLGQ